MTPMRFSAMLASSLLLIIVLAQTACSVATEPVELFRSGEFESAFEIFSERAANNDMAAINFLGIHYYLGAAVERDFEWAVRYFGTGSAWPQCRCSAQPCDYVYARPRRTPGQSSGLRLVLPVIQWWQRERTRVFEKSGRQCHAERRRQGARMGRDGIA